MKRSVVIAIGIGVLFIGGVLFVHREKPLTTGEVPRGVQTVEGVVTEVAASARVVTITTTAGQTLLLALREHSQVFDVGSNATTTVGFILPTFTVRATGEFTKVDVMIPSKIDIVTTPGIIVYSPKPNGEVGLPIVVTGESRTFENNVLARVVDADGTVLAETFTTAIASDTGQYGQFEFRFNYKTPSSATGKIEVYEGSAKDGSEIHKIIVPVRFATVESVMVKAYFPNEKNNGMECEATYPVTRRVAKTGAPARAALEELLAGPTNEEYRAGFSTAINGGVKIKSLVIGADGTANVDFDAMMNAGVAGSCRVLAIHSQIRETLMQFPSVKKVVVSVEGNVDEVLQP